MKKIIISIIVIAVIVLAIIVIPPKSENSDVTKVTIAMVTFPGYAPLYIAEEKGLWGEDVDVEIVRIESIGDMRAAMRSGNIDIYAATYDIFQAVEDTIPPGVAFLAIDESYGGDGVVVSEDIMSLADLRGKKVGAEPGFPPYFILQYLLNQEGMTLADVDFQDVTSQDAGNAFVAGRLDVAATYEPYLSLSAEKVPGAKILVSSADTPNLVVDFLFASDDLVQNNPKVLEAIAQGWFNAVTYWENNPDDAYVIMADAFGVSVEEMKDFKTGITWLTLDDNQNLFDKLADNNAYQTFTLVGDILEANGEAGVRVRAEDHLTNTIINQF
jgi:NitT/TauT family transport system substrate-binding protein